MKAYRRILIPSISAGPSDAQLSCAAELARASNGDVTVAQFIDVSSGFESDGPAGVLPGELAARKVPAARRRLELILAGSPLAWARSSVTYGEPDTLLANAMRESRPDLVIVSSGWGHARWVERAAHKAGIAIPDILGVKSDGLLSRLLNSLLPQSVSSTHQPLHDKAP